MSASTPSRRARVGEAVGNVRAEAARRRAFAVISHPDAGKTTLTEKLLVYAGAVAEAGAVKARRGRRTATSDWLELERQRGISISAAVLRFEIQGLIYNLVDTPGHRDFSEDTLRVLAAVDSAVILLDAAKGVEPQTLKLFEVAQARGIPLLTFVNKFDRPGLDPLGILDDIERSLDLRPTPVTWPIGRPGDFRGVVDRRDRSVHLFTRTAGGATVGAERVVSFARAEREHADVWPVTTEELALLDGVGADLDVASYLAGESTPVFFGSAISNFGVRLLLHALAKLAPSPSSPSGEDGVARALDASFSGQVFKVQANTDPRHRDRLAFVRVATGRFERGMRVTNARTGRALALSYAHELFGQERTTVDEGNPGDVIAVVNPGDVRPSDTLYDGAPVRYRAIPTLAPEHFVGVRNKDTSRYKQFRRGLTQLDEEGVVHVLRRPGLGDQGMVLAGVGPLQFDVAIHRLEHEFGARAELAATHYSIGRRTDAAGEEAIGRWHSGEVLHRADGTRMAAFANEVQLEGFAREHADIPLESVVSDRPQGPASRDRSLV